MKVLLLKFKKYCEEIYNKIRDKVNKSPLASFFCSLVSLFGVVSCWVRYTVNENTKAAIETNLKLQEQLTAFKDLKLEVLRLKELQHKLWLETHDKIDTVISNTPVNDDYTRLFIGAGLILLTVVLCGAGYYNGFFGAASASVNKLGLGEMNALTGSSAVKEWTYVDTSAHKLTVWLNDENVCNMVLKLHETNSEITIDKFLEKHSIIRACLNHENQVLEGVYSILLQRQERALDAETFQALVDNLPLITEMQKLTIYIDKFTVLAKMLSEIP